MSQEEQSIDYSLSHLKRKKIVFFLIALFCLTLLVKFPMKSLLNQKLQSLLQVSPSCTIDLQKNEFEFFLPKIIFGDVTLPAGCVFPQKQIKLKETSLHFRGLSFSPFGLSFKLETTYKQNQLEAFFIPSFNSISILLENESEGGKFLGKTNKINFSDLKEFLPIVRFNGDLVISTLFLQLSYGGSLKDFILNVSTNNFLFPKQSIMGFDLEKMDINSLLIQLNLLPNNKLRIKKFIIGDEQSPLKANFSGELKLNTRNLKTSFLNTQGELFVSDKILQDIFLLKSILDRFDKKGKFYQIEIKSPLNSILSNGLSR